MSTLNVTALKHESAGVDNLVLDSSGNTIMPYGSSLSFNSPTNQYISADANNLYLGTGNLYRIKVDTAGCVTMPYQPCFIGTHNNQYASNFTGGSIIPVNYAYTNIGNHFNTSTYTFTVPVSGIYEVIMSDIGTSTTDNAGIGIYVNGSVGTKYYMNSTRDKLNVALIYLTQNDAVTFRVVEGSCTLYGSSYYGRYQIRLAG